MLNIYEKLGCNYQKALLSILEDRKKYAINYSYKVLQKK